MNMEAVESKHRLLPSLCKCKLCLSVVLEVRDCAGFYHYECSNTECENRLYDYEHWQTGRKAWNERNKPLVRCAANRDGECVNTGCPQLRDKEPHATGRHCPLDNYDDED